jgi:hypothetical protein
MEGSKRINPTPGQGESDEQKEEQMKATFPVVAT